MRSQVVILDTYQKLRATSLKVCVKSTMNNWNLCILQSAPSKLTVMTLFWFQSINNSNINKKKKKKKKISHHWWWGAREKAAKSHLDESSAAVHWQTTEAKLSRESLLKTTCPKYTRIINTHRILNQMNTYGERNGQCQPQWHFRSTRRR